MTDHEQDFTPTDTSRKSSTAQERERHEAYEYIAQKLNGLNLGIESLRRIAPDNIFVYGDGIGVLLSPTLAYTRSEDDLGTLRVLRTPGRVDRSGFLERQKGAGQGAVFWDEVSDVTRDERVPQASITGAKGVVDQIVGSVSKFRAQPKSASHL